MHKRLEDWAMTMANTLRDQGFLLEIIRSPDDIDKSSITLDLNTGSLLGRVTVWSSGECFVELMSALNGDTVMNTYYQLAESCELHAVF